MPTYVISLIVMLSLAAPAAAQGPTTGDRDHDGVADAQDLCPDDTSAAPKEPDGCGTFRALALINSGKDMSELAADSVKGNQAQCYYSRGEECSFHVELTLSAASAKKLKLKSRKIGEVDVTTNKEQKHYYLKYVNYKWDFSGTVRRAFKKATDATMTLSGTYTRGSGQPIAFEPKTFKAEKEFRGSPQVGLDTRGPLTEPTDG